MKILILTEPGDIHAIAVAEGLKRKGKAPIPLSRSWSRPRPGGWESYSAFSVPTVRASSNVARSRRNVGF